MAAHLARVLAAAAALVLLSAVVATQVLAAHFHNPSQFGDGIADVARERLYTPAESSSGTRWERTCPRAFSGAALAGFTVLAWPCLALIARARRAQLTPSAFGEGAWAQMRDVRQAGFIRPDGAPAGRVLGRFEGKLLT